MKNLSVARPIYSKKKIQEAQEVQLKDLCKNIKKKDLKIVDEVCDQLDEIYDKLNKSNLSDILWKKYYLTIHSLKNTITELESMKEVVETQINLNNKKQESKTLLQEKEAKILENINTMKINGVEHEIYDVKLKDDRGNIFKTSYPVLPEERNNIAEVLQAEYEPYKVVSFKPQDTSQFGLETPRLDTADL